MELEYWCTCGKQIYDPNALYCSNECANAANDFIAPMTVNGHIDLTTQGYTTSSNEAQDNYVSEQVSGQNLPRSVMDTVSSLPYNFFNIDFNPDNFFNMDFNPPPQIPTNDPEIFRFAIPGFQIIVIPTSSPFANLSNFDIQCQLQQEQAFPSYTTSISHSQLNQDVSGVYETHSGSSVIHNNHQQQHHHQQNSQNFNNLRN
jgi:hypothetical protein